jgi:hypothetical protein
MREYRCADSANDGVFRSYSANFIPGTLGRPMTAARTVEGEYALTIRNHGNTPVDRLWVTTTES